MSDTAPSIPTLQSRLTKERTQMATLRVLWSITLRPSARIAGKWLTLSQFSDEFNSDGRTFYDGDDPFFQAVDLWYGVTQDLEVRCSFAVPFSRDSSTLTSSQWYDPDAISTANGTLNIQFDAYPNHGLEYRSGMLQSWNKMCFKGGHVEASISLPGAGNVIGFWPGFWAMGNLGRPGYPATTEGMWPYTYWDRCDIGITANQSSGDGLSHLPGMKMPACTCNPEDLDQHPTPGKSRSAPEIDALEGNVIFLNRQFDHPIGSGAQSLQCAPFDPWYQPDYGTQNTACSENLVALCVLTRLVAP